CDRLRGGDGGSRRAHRRRPLGSSVGRAETEQALVVAHCRRRRGSVFSRAHRYVSIFEQVDEPRTLAATVGSAPSPHTPQSLGSRVSRCASTRGRACLLRLPVAIVGMMPFRARSHAAPGSTPKKCQPTWGTGAA